MQPSRPYPLAGLTVIDLGQIYQGPYCAFLLAMAGASVIKVEPPTGEPVRRRAAVAGGSLPLAMLNSNKRDVSLNLKSPRGRELLIEMVKRADVLVENFAPTVMDRLGVGAAALHAANPGLIYASGSGYGRSGPKRDDLAMDLTVQAVAGVMSVTGLPGGPPVKAGPAICDFLGGVHLYAAIVTALYERERTGVGRVVEVAMQDAVYPTLSSNLGMHYGSGGNVPPRTGNRHGGLSMSPYNVYATRDGHVAIICVTEEHWRNLAHAMGRSELADDPRFANHTTRAAIMDTVDEIVGAWCASLTRDEVHEIARRCRVPSAPVRDLTEVMNDSQMHERGMLHWMDHPELGRVVLPGSPLRFEGTPPLPLVASPFLGQHNAEVYGDWLGLSAEEIARLASDGVI